MVTIKVCLLDNTTVKFDVGGKQKGDGICEMVYKHLNLSEGEYFGIQYYDKHDKKCWLDPLRALNKQVKDPSKVIFHLAVKFYAADPVELQEEQTRYLFMLQIRKDLLNGRLVCNDNTACLLASYYIQGELGDYDPLQHVAGYLRETQFFPGQREEHEEKIMEYHKRHRGEDPSDVDRNILDVARRLDTYGITLYPCRANDNAQVNLSVAHMGVLVFQNKSRINTFSWANIRKLSFHRKKFLIKLHPEVNHKDTLEFLMASRDDAKSFWKLTASTHTFFRQYQLKAVGKTKPKILGRGSRYRHSGRTQKQVMESSKQTLRNDSTFNRSQSLRLPSVTRGSSSSVPSSPKTIVGYGNIETRVIETDYPAANESLVSVTSNDESREYEPNEDISIEQSRVNGEINKQSTEEINVNETTEQPESNENDATPIMVNGNDVTPDTFKLDFTATSESDGDDLNQEAFDETLLIPSFSPIGLYQSNDSIEKKLPKGTAYHIAKEILQTERTYVKDLEVITIAFRNAVFEKDVLLEKNKELLFSNFDPIYDFHCLFLEELQQRLTLWESQEISQDEHHRIGDVMFSNLMQIRKFTKLVANHDHVLLEIYKATKTSAEFDKLYKDFELQPLCYLTFNKFLLKPSQRLAYYKFILERLVQFYPTGHVDYEDCKGALDEITEIVQEIESTRKTMENYQKLIELERDLIGIENLVLKGREFIREGCLRKISQSSSQPRMFFLFNDALLFTSKGVTSTNQFQIQGKFEMSKISVIEEDDMHGLYCFTISSEEKSYMLAATSQVEKAKWLEDLNLIITRSKSPDAPSLNEVVINSNESEDDETKSKFTSLDKRYAHCRTMSTRRVCWHRNTSVSALEYSISVRNQLSGELQRKFKSGDKWQKLFVVLTNFCLFFYKTHEDEQPVASLPLIGYAVTKPNNNDNISKELVIKLQYKTHVYFFRADSEYSFFRWMEVICSATQNSNRTRLFSRQTSVAP